MNLNRTAERLTGIMLGATVLLMLGHIAAEVLIGSGRVSVGLILLHGIPAIFAGSSLYTGFQKHGSTLAMYSGILLSGHGLLMVLTAVMLMVGLQYPEQFALLGAEPDPHTGTASAFESVMNKTGKSAYALMGLSYGLLGALVLKGGFLPRWIGWTGVVVGSLGFLACTAAVTDVIAHGTAEIATGACILASLAFTLLTAAKLVS